MPLRPDVLRDLQLHQRLAQHPRPLAQEICVLLDLRLAQQRLQCHPHLVGHRRGSSRQVSTTR